MRWLIVCWLLSAGVGLSYSVVTERKSRIQQLKAMEHSLKRLAYYMYRWRMPVKEALEHVSKEEYGVLYDFYQSILKALTERKTEDFGLLWKEESSTLWKEESGALWQWEGQWRKHAEAEKEHGTDIKHLWNTLFFNIPMEPEALNQKLIFGAEEIAAYRAAMEGKYKGEQRLVFTMGFFVSAFFCLILW